MQMLRFPFVLDAIETARARLAQACLALGYWIMPSGVLEYAQARGREAIDELIDDFVSDRTGGDDAYTDARFEPKACDECGGTFNGPSRYCSRRCAVVGAGVRTFGRGHIGGGGGGGADGGSGTLDPVLTVGPEPFPPLRPAVDISAADFRDDVGSSTVGAIGEPSATIDVRTGRRLVDAYRLPAEGDDLDHDRFMDWLDRLDVDRDTLESSYDQILICHSPDGPMDAMPGDWLVRCSDAIVRPVKPQIFDQFFQARHGDGS